MYEEQPQKREGREVWRESIDFEGKWAKVIDSQFGGGHKKHGKCLHDFT